jgi:hypothetical protein
MKHVIDIKKIYNNFGRKIMKWQKGFFVSILSFVLFLFVLMVTYTSGQMNVAAQGQGRPQVVAIQGLAKVEGQDAIVEILVAVQPGENAMAKAREKLRRMYPDAVEIDSSNYDLTGLDWNDDTDFQNNNNQVTFFYNSSDVPVTFDASVKDGSYYTWNNVGTSIFEFVDSGTTSECPSLVKECKGRQFFNGDNEIAWLDIRESSVLGVVWSGTSTLTGPEFDMALDNADFDWYVGTDPKGILSNQIDLQTVWIHEFGHGLGLGHSEFSDSVMFPKYTKPRRDLHQDDIDGINSLYGDAKPKVTITTPNNGQVIVENTSFSYAGTVDDGGEDDLLGVLAWELTDDSEPPISVTLPDGSGGTISEGLLRGGYTITASIQDDALQTGSDSVNIEVIVLGDSNENDTYVWAIDFTEKRKGRGGSMVDLITTVTIRRDSDASGSAESEDELVGGATVYMDLARDGRTFIFSGTTNSEGIVKFTLQRALIDTPYKATVTRVTHSNPTYTYNDLLDVGNGVTHTILP